MRRVSVVETRLCRSEWKDMALLAPPNRFPASDGLRGSVAAFTSVAYDTADEASVSGGNAVVQIGMERYGASRPAEPIPSVRWFARQCSRVHERRVRYGG